MRLHPLRSPHQKTVTKASAFAMCSPVLVMAAMSAQGNQSIYAYALEQARRAVAIDLHRRRYAIHLN